MVTPKVRVIARLDIKGPNLVKGIHLEGLRVLGDPAAYARHYYLNGADELFYMDVVASLYERNSLSDIIGKTARETFIPLTVGGGIRTVDDIRKVLRAGADKVCINTGAIKNPEFIRKAAELFGSSTIVGAIECIKQPHGRYLAFVDNGREETGLEAVAWAKKLEELGVGEIVVTSVDKEGTGEGVDFHLIQSIANQVSIPVIAHGGIGRPADGLEAIKAGASAIAVASVLHYEALMSGKIAREASKIEGNTRFLEENRSYKKIVPCELKDLKEAIHASGLPVRGDFK
jgi:cyclase